MKFEVFDFETIKIKDNFTKPIAISYFDNGKIDFKKLNGEEGACLFIINTFKGCCVYYAHNLLFDFFQISNYIIKNFKIEWLYVNNNLYGLTIFTNGKKINFKC